MKLSRLIATAALLASAVGSTTARTDAGALQAHGPGGSAPRAHGQGSGIYLHPPFTGDRVSIELDASGSGGHFDIVHYDKFGKVFSELSGTVNCVAVNGRTAVTTGTITAGHAPEIAGDPRGKSFAITIVDNDGVPDAIGVSFPIKDIPPCSAWPLNMVMDRGGYKIG
jgi:hypothetical protein